jgi:hypothetical protein
MTSRRAYLAAVGGMGGLASLAGCLDVIGGGPATFEASPARVSQSALDETGYSFDGLSEQVTEEEFSAGGQSRTVEVTNKLATYDRTVDLGPLGEQVGSIFAVVTTPQVTVLGREFNPVEDQSATELATTIQDQFLGIENLQQEDEGSVTIDGEGTTTTKFRADAGYDGSPIKLTLHVSEAVEMGEDFLVTVGVHPELLFGEGDRIRSLMQGVEPGDPEN